MDTEIVKNHRTILFVDARDPSDTFVERANRLIESLNGAQIKVDVHAVRTRTATRVEPVERLGFEGPSYAYESDDEFNVTDLTRLARDYGYDQVIFSVAP